MDNEIAKTLGELERKLHELEGALAAIDRSDRSSRRAAPEDGAAPAVPERPADPSAGSPLEARSGEQRPAGVGLQRPSSVPAQRPDRAAASQTAEEHAGAIVSGTSGTAAAKAQALEARGVRVGRTPTQVAEIAVEVLGGASLPAS